VGAAVIANVFGFGEKKLKTDLTKEASHASGPTGKRVREHTKILASLESLLHILGVRGERNELAPALF